MFFFFFFNDTATTEIYTLSLHDALPISLVELGLAGVGRAEREEDGERDQDRERHDEEGQRLAFVARRSEEHTSELQSRQYLVCRLLLEKKKKISKIHELRKFCDTDRTE